MTDQEAAIALKEDAASGYLSPELSEALNERMDEALIEMSKDG